MRWFRYQTDRRFRAFGRSGLAGIAAVAIASMALFRLAPPLGTAGLILTFLLLVAGLSVIHAIMSGAG